MNVISWKDAKRDSLLVFHHLPKTAGTAFSAALSNMFGGDSYAWFHGPAGALQEINRNTKFKAVGGHFHLSHRLAKEIKRPVVLITLFREPTDRVISNYYYLQRNSDHHLHGMANQHTLEEIFTSGMGERLQVENQIVKMVSSVTGDMDEMLASAKENIHKYTFFGFQDQISILEALVQQKYEVEEFKVPDLISRSKRPRGVSPIELLKIIREHNQYDLELYDFAKDIYNKKLGGAWI